MWNVKRKERYIKCKDSQLSHWSVATETGAISEV